jgi:hypothetical protein
MVNLITSAVHNNLTYAVPLRVPGYASTHEPVVVPASATFTLLGPMTADELLGIQPLIHSLIAVGAFTQTATVDSETFIV